MKLMKHRLMDLLACPIDKSWPLKLEIKQEVIEEEEISLPLENPNTGVICGFFCNFKHYMLINVDDKGNEVTKPLVEIQKNVTLEDCKQCFQIDIQTGKIYCNENSTHEYEIKEGIPVMLSKEKIQEIYGKRRNKNKK